MEFLSYLPTQTHYQFKLNYSKKLYKLVSLIVRKYALFIHI